MTKTISGLVCFLFFVSFANAVTIEYPVELSLPIARTVEPKTTSPSDISALITKYAIKYDVSESLMHKLVSCESGYNPIIVNSNAREFSVGLSQINLKAHTNITREQAENPDFALDFMASNIKKGYAKTMWVTCSK